MPFKCINIMQFNARLKAHIHATKTILSVRLAVIFEVKDERILANLIVCLQFEPYS